MREIGSEFWKIPVTKNMNTLFPKSTKWFLSGRNALTAIIREIKKSIKMHTVAVPSWCCDSMIVPFLQEGVEVHFYPVYYREGLVQEINENCDVLFLMDYFGYTTNLTSSHPCTIRDVTHSLFSHQYDDAKYYFGSLRKWCGTKTGGYAWGIEPIFDGKEKRYIELRTVAMCKKEDYITGKINNKDYLKIYEKAEKRLDEISGVYCAFQDDVTAACHLDTTSIRVQRRKNARVLMNAFTDQLIFPSLFMEDCPLFVPILVPDEKRDNLRRYLIRHDIYCPVHWPVSKYHKLMERELYIYQNELSLVCDQRYTEEDMYRIVEVIENFWKER